MNPKDDRTESAQHEVGTPPPRKRLRIRKLEDRIAPKKTKYTHTNCGQGTISTGTYY